MQQHEIPGWLTFGRGATTAERRTLEARAHRAMMQDRRAARRSLVALVATGAVVVAALVHAAGAIASEWGRPVAPAGLEPVACVTDAECEGASVPVYRDQCRPGVGCRGAE